MSQSGFCTECGFKVASYDGLACCPNCGTESIPCADNNQVTIAINWHELHLLCVWAEQWAHAKCGGAGVVYSIAGRLAAQYPERHALTLAGEVRELQAHFGREHIETHGIQGVE